MSERGLQGDILTPQGWCRGHIAWDAEGRIDSIQGDPVQASDVGRDGRGVLLPGFIDLHVHGAGGHDVMQADQAVAEIGRRLVAHGTTAWLATTMTAPADEIERALLGVAPHCRRGGHGGGDADGALPHLLGVHLEGPYISRAKLGAQPDCTALLDLAQVRRWHAVAPIRVLTLSPEPQHLPAIPALCDMGIRVQLGHSNASYETACEALQAGASGFTHLFNAMSALSHRAPGMVGAAIAHAPYAEIIPDLLHVHPGAVRAALRAIPGLYCVSDGTAATGMPDGSYLLGRQRVNKCLGGVRLPDGTLAGSVLTLDLALRHLVALGLPLAEASARVSSTAADYLGLHEHGRLRAGAWADLVVLNAELQVKAVYVAGRAASLAGRSHGGS